MRLVGICAVLALLIVPIHASPRAPQAAGDCPRPPDNAFGSTTKGELGIEGRIYFLPEGSQKLPDFAKEQSRGSIFTDQWDISSREFTNGFPGVTDRFEWFAIDYQGPIYVPVAGEYAFRLFSDDGSRLSVDGAVVIDNDGIHGWDLQDGSVTLTQGNHMFRLSYFQGPATELGLRLLVTAPGSDYQKVFRLQDFNKAIADTRRLLGVTENKDEIRIRFGAEVLFDTGTYALKSAAEESLKQLSSFLRDYPGYPIVIEGHTDNVGTPESNIVLSEHRAESVRDYLVTQGNIAAGCVSTKGLGLTEPIAENSTAQGRQKNRRVEVKLDKGS
jgi:outer membrane protein OmpA-like peptidoglycan-associated protein